MLSTMRLQWTPELAPLLLPLPSLPRIIPPALYGETSVDRVVYGTESRPSVNVASSPVSALAAGAMAPRSAAVVAVAVGTPDTARWSFSTVGPATDVTW